MLRRSLGVFLIAASATLAFAGEQWKGHQPKLTPQKSGTTQLLISVSPVDDRVVWAAGTGGTYVVTTDGGKHWKAAVVPGAEKLQFRDVQGVGDKVAYLMSVPITGKNIVLADDVLYTGRTIRAALDALFRQGRPKRVQLCVLIDRGHRELPIEATFVGRKVQTTDNEIIEVKFREIDDAEKVLLVEKQA